jgi:hypothetical protein
MRRTLRKRFCLKTSMAAITSILFLITLLWRNWIELVFNVDPDAGSGSIEWLIVAVLFVMTLALFLLARRDWRIAQKTLGSQSLNV